MSTLLMRYELRTVLRVVLGVTLVGVAIAQQHSPESERPSPPQHVSPRVAQGLLCGSDPKGEAKPTSTESRINSGCGPVSAPIYPLEAQKQRIQGTVLLTVTINRRGKVEDVLVLQGHPMLVPAAVEAVRAWRYKPYYVKGKPVSVETNVTVNFTLKSQ